MSVDGQQAACAIGIARDGHATGGVGNAEAMSANSIRELSDSLGS
jgi:hypothetical protein